MLIGTLLTWCNNMIFQMHEVESRIFQSVRITLVKLEKSGFLQVLLRFYPIPIVQTLMMSLYNQYFLDFEES